MKREKEGIKAVKAAEMELVEKSDALAQLVDDTPRPFSAGFDTFFDKHGICRLQYFGGSLQGEDINAICSSTAVITEMTDQLKVRQINVSATRVVSIGSDERAAGMARVCISFGRLHCLYNRKAPLCRHELEAYPGWVAEFAISFAEVLPEVKPTPKLHTITHHHLDILKLKGSIGFETEQGMEGYHCECNAVERNTGNTRDQHKKVALTMQRTWERASASDFYHAKHARAERAREKKRQKRGTASGFYECEVRVDPEE